MRTIDKRTAFGRRTVLRGGAAVMPVALAGISAGAAWAQAAKNLPPDTFATLVKAARDIYPHDLITDSFYVAAAQPWDTKAGTDPAFKTMLTDGVVRLDSDAKNQFGFSYIALPWEADRVNVLRQSEKTPFFEKIRSDLVVSLYNQPAIWPKFGYEGPSAQLGGYLHRGFDDIDWLPSS